ncbi:MAG: M12 family metallo-peptidase [Pseudomonadaceae bacterium]|nr:M12 family metallo-peptidase [Pseudomonadaceae bacterium]
MCGACGGGGGSSGSASPVAAASPPPATSQGGSPTVTTEIRLLAVASESLEAVVGDVDLELNHLVNTTNDVLASNGVNVAFALDHIEVVSYPDSLTTEQALEAITFGSDPAFSHIAQLRDDLAADLVVYFRPYANDGSCGYAWIGGYGTDGDFSNPVEAEFGYSVVAADCSDYSLLHELGHNLGLAHSRLEAPDGGSFAWGVGHGETNDFVTIMASPSAFNGVRLPQLSNPAADCNGEPCGVPATDLANGADAVRAIEAVAEAVAAYR